MTMPVAIHVTHVVLPWYRGGHRTGKLAKLAIE